MDLLVSGVSFSSNKSSSLLLDAKLSWACLQDGNKSRILLFVFGNLSLQSNYGNDLDSLRMKVWHMEFKTLQFYSNIVWFNLLKSVWYGETCVCFLFYTDVSMETGKEISQLQFILPLS